MLDAIVYALYGKPYRLINKPQLVNTITQKNTLVEVEFKVRNKKYKVIRGIKPSVFEIYENDKLIDQSANVRDYQEILEKRILKLNYKSFTQIVVVGSANFIPFMQLTTADRRTVIEDLLDIDIFTKMYTLLKDKVTTNKTTLVSTNHTIDLLKQRIHLTKDHLSDIQNINKKDNEYKQKQLDDITQKTKTSQDNIASFIKQIENFNKGILDLDNIKKKNKKLVELDFKFKHKIATLDSEIKFFNEANSCPTCDQQIEKNIKDNKIKDCEHKKKELTEAGDKLIKELNVVVDRINDITNIQEKITKLNSGIMLENLNISVYQKTFTQLSNDIKAPEDNIDVDSKKKDLNKLNEELNEQENKSRELNDTKIVYDIAILLLKDSGIKTKIIKQYVPIINKLVNKYLATLEFFVQFELDEQFNEKIKSRFRDDFTYSSFSEGEKMRIDLSLLFTWRAVAKLRNSASTNLLILDEVFDSSLDYSGTDEFLKLLSQLTNDTNVFVISHKGDQLFDKFHSIIKFEKVKNFSRIAT
jgi:DNA repair exonuclease SbcCD ATPase subunit